MRRGAGAAVLLVLTVVTAIACSGRPPPTAARPTHTAPPTEPASRPSDAKRSAPRHPPGRLALVVADPSALNASDAALAAHLRQRGFDVDVSDDDDAQDVAGGAYGAIVVSKTGKSEKTGEVLRTVDAGVLFWEDNLQQRRFLATADDDGEDGTAWHARGRDVTLAVCGAGSPAPTVRLLSQDAEVVHAPSGKLVASADVIATWPGDPARPTIYTVDAGAKLADGARSAGRRAFFPLYDDTFRLLTDDGQALFDAALDWASGKHDAALRAAARLACG